MPSVRKLFPAWMAVLFCLAPARAQNAPRALPAAMPSLNQLVHSSGYIFSGAVTAVDEVPPTSGNAVAAMRITFRVEQAVLGVRPGQTLVIREWAGLWKSGPRYRVGEQVVLLLYPTSRLGLTSPVGGPMGRFSADRNGLIALEPSRVQTLWPTRPIITTPVAGKVRFSTRDFVSAIRRAGK